MGGSDADLLLSPIVNLIRGTPALVQILGWYLISSVLGVPLDPFAAVLVALAVNSAAFISETLRGAIRAVPRGQREAAVAIGLSTTYSVLAIELPQALPAIIPALMGFFIGLVKDTSLAYLVGLYELTTTAKIIADREFRPLEIYLAIAVVYFALCFPSLASSRSWNAGCAGAGLRSSTSPSDPPSAAERRSRHLVHDRIGAARRLSPFSARSSPGTSG